MLFEITAYAEGAKQSAAEAGMAGGIPLIGMLAVWVAIFYFLLIRPQKKRQRKFNDMIDALQVNDEVVTTGGIMGKIASIKEDSVVIETGSDRTKIKFDKSAISKVLTIHE